MPSETAPLPAEFDKDFPHDTDPNNINPAVIPAEFSDLMTHEIKPPVVSIEQLRTYFAGDELGESIVDDIENGAIAYAKTIIEFNKVIMESKDDISTNADLRGTVDKVRTGSHSAFIISVNAAIRYLHKKNIREPWMTHFDPYAEPAETPKRSQYTKLAMAMVVDMLKHMPVPAEKTESLAA